MLLCFVIYLLKYIIIIITNEDEKAGEEEPNPDTGDHGHNLGRIDKGGGNFSKFIYFFFTQGSSLWILELEARF